MRSLALIQYDFYKKGNLARDRHARRKNAVGRFADGGVGGNEPTVTDDGGRAGNDRGPEPATGLMAPRMTPLGRVNGLRGIWWEPFHRSVDLG